MTDFKVFFYLCLGALRFYSISILTSQFHFSRSNAFQCRDFLLTYLCFVFCAECTKEDFLQYSCIPCGLFSQSGQRFCSSCLLPMIAQQAQYHFHHSGIVFCCIVHSFSTSIFSENYIKHPMHAFHLPMITNRMGDSCATPFG